MAVQLNHTIVGVRDKHESATFGLSSFALVGSPSGGYAAQQVAVQIPSSVSGWFFDLSVTAIVD